MKFIPAIDIKEGNCVRLFKGKENSSIVYNTDPIKQAKFFENEGCKRIHIIDLDAAFNNNINNKNKILEIRNSVSTEIELGGGIRTEENISFWLDRGINFLIVGSLAITEPDNIKKIAKTFPEKIYISLDDHDGKIMIYGWTKESSMRTEQVLKKYNKSKIKGFIFTDISRDGTLDGINIKKIDNYLKISKKPIIVGGGLSNKNDLKNLLNLKNSFLEGVIAGKSIYSGKINIKEVKKIFDLNA